MKRLVMAVILLGMMAWVGCNSSSNSESMGPVTKAEAMLTAAQISQAMHKATAWHMNMKSTDMEMDMDVVCPDRMHVQSKTRGNAMEMIRVGNEMYTKMGSKWTKMPTAANQAAVCGGAPSGQPSGGTSKTGASSAGAAWRVPTLDVNMKMSKGGTETINGDTCTDWNGTVTETDGKTRTWTLCVGSDNLPRMMKSEAATITYSNWNKPATIEAPKM